MSLLIFCNARRALVVRLAASHNGQNDSKPRRWRLSDDARLEAHAGDFGGKAFFALIILFVVVIVGGILVTVITKNDCSCSLPA